ncbi:MAG TPA: hypothetical protein PKC28_02640 [Bdellovibrionales bacterium]|nr:hypothetical protein [Bdellovibrionales bacterium]
MEKIRPTYWIRPIIMTATLIAVMSIIYKIKQQGGGFFTGAPMVEGREHVSRTAVHLCPTRVSSLSVIGKFAILQDGMKWYRSRDGQREEVNQIAVEKWFSEHCTVKADLMDMPPTAAVTAPIVTLAYVSGEPVTLQRSADGLFALGKNYFRSPELEAALESLEQIPSPTVPGGK